MRKLIWALTTLAALQGCASSPTSTDESLSSLQLFGADAQPRFVADLACAGSSAQETNQCATVSNAFYAWANARHIRLHSTGRDEALFDAGHPSAEAMKLSKPYRVAIHFQPFFAASELAGTAGTYVPGEAGYEATVYVFDATSGALIKKMNMRRRQEIPEQANVTPFIRADAEDVIARMDSGYSHP